MGHEVGGSDRTGRPGMPGPYLLGGCEAGEGTQVGGVGDEHGLLKQPCVCVLGHVRLMAVEGCREEEERRGGCRHGTLGQPECPLPGQDWCPGGSGYSAYQVPNGAVVGDP